MSYRTLKAVFHIKDRVAADAEEAARRTSPAAVTWDFSIGDHAMFCLITPEIAVLIERVMSLESTIRGQWSALPGVARAHYLKSMIIEEIQATNEIEAVHSSRQEISEALDALRDDDTVGTRRFKEMVRLYSSLGDETVTGPENLDDIRSIYDSVTAGEVRDEDAPDGERFRTGPVTITSGQKAVHSGVVPESAINAGLTTMLEQSRDDEIPQLVRAVVAHFIFENVHPFYDGNGRTGRFLLAVELSRSLTPVAWLSLSATIADDKDRYYRAFADVENPLNRGDVTPFVVAMLEIIASAQSRLESDLVDRLTGLRRLSDVIGELPLEDDPTRNIVFIVGQAVLFGPGGAITLDEIAAAAGKSKQFVRKRIEQPVDAGIIETVTKRPLRFRLSPSWRQDVAI